MNLSLRQSVTRCACGTLTSKAYALTHAGLCKACVESTVSQVNALLGSLVREAQEVLS
jgi:hypothetical protein